MANAVVGVRGRVSVSVWEYIQGLRGGADTRVCAQRKAHPVHQRGLFPLVSGCAAIKPSTFRTQSVLRMDTTQSTNTWRVYIPTPKLVRVIVGVYQQTDLSSLHV